MARAPRRTDNLSVTKLPLPQALEKEIIEFCELNELDVEEFFQNMVTEAFNRKKYGDVPKPIKMVQLKDEHRGTMSGSVAHKIIEPQPMSEPKREILQQVIKPLTNTEDDYDGLYTN
jgi:hypothetical protein